MSVAMRSIAATLRGAARTATSATARAAPSSLLLTRAQPLRPTFAAPASAAFSSGTASYPASAYQNAPDEPKFNLPTDAPEHTWELFYFALRGRAEQVRLLLVEADLPYVDRLLSQWQLRKLKAAGSPISNPDFTAAQRASPLPFGGLPLLRRKQGDITLGQTPAILQLLAEEGKLMPATALGRARAQMLIAGTEDLFQAYWPIKLDQNKYEYHSGSFPLTPGTNEGYISSPATYLKSPFDAYTVPKGFRRETLPRWLTFFEVLLSAPESKGAEFFIDGKLSYVDVVVFAHLQAVRSIEPECLQPFPKLLAHYKRMESRPRIAAYLAKRPASGL